MASVINTIKRLYTDENTVPFHVFILTLSAITSYSFVAFQKNSLIAIGAYVISFVIIAGMIFKATHNRLNLIETLPEVDEQNLIIVLKYMPILIIFAILGFILNLIPIIGVLIQFVFGLSLYPIINVRFCKNYKVGEAFDYNKIKELFGAFILPNIFLAIKLFLFLLIVILAMAFSLGAFARDNVFLFITILLYIISINYYIYMDNLAQIYSEVDFYDNDNYNDNYTDLV